MTGLDIASGLDVTRTPVTDEQRRQRDHDRRRAGAAIAALRRHPGATVAGSDAERAAIAWCRELIEALGLDGEPGADPDLPVCAYRPCGQRFLPRSRRQRYCQSVCVLRASHEPPAERVLTPIPTGTCSVCSASRVPLTGAGKVGRHQELRIRATPTGARRYRSHEQCAGFNTIPEPSAA